MPRSRIPAHPTRRIMVAVACAIAAGAMGGVLTADGMRPQAPSLMAMMTPKWAAADPYDPDFGASETDRGRGWAASAYHTGLRNCPDPTAEFLAGCRARMIEEARAEQALAAWRETERQRYGRDAALAGGYSEPVEFEPYRGDSDWAAREIAVQTLERQPTTVPAERDAIVPPPAAPESAPWRSLAQPAQPQAAPEVPQLALASAPAPTALPEPVAPESAATPGW